MTRPSLLLLAFWSSLAACATSPSPPSWQKTGASEATLAKDSSEFRELAEREAMRRYPAGFSSPSFGAAGMMVSQQRDETNRSTVEAASFNTCMVGRGYAPTPAR
jgi:hypothetical protein